MKRRRFIRDTSALAGAQLLGCDSESDTPSAETEKTTLRILRWTHFVTVYDAWFAQLAESWGDAQGINVEIEYIDFRMIGKRLKEAIAAGEGPDIIESHTTSASLENELTDLSDVAAEIEENLGPQASLALASSYNPHTRKYYGLTTAYSVWPAIYRRSSWAAAGLPDGPTTFDELLTYGETVFQQTGQMVGLGFADENNSARTIRTILWAFGGRVQDENQQVALDSAGTRAAMAYAKELVMRTTDTSEMTMEDVFSWTPASNNQAVLKGTSSYVINPISAYRESQRQDPLTAQDLYFTKPPVGPSGEGRAIVSTFTQLIPEYAVNKQAAKDFIVHMVSAGAFEVFNSELSNIPAYEAEINSYFSVDPFGSDPPDKLSLFSDATGWSANIGWPAASNAAAADVFNESILAEMFRTFIRGEVNEDVAIANALARINPIFEQRRSEGLL